MAFLKKYTHDLTHTAADFDCADHTEDYILRNVSCNSISIEADKIVKGRFSCVVFWVLCLKQIDLFVSMMS